jgi:hypothetical protein
LDRYCADERIAHIDLLKIDVEGFEQRVLAGADELLTRGCVDVVLVEVSDSTLIAAGTRAFRLLEFLEDKNLRPHRLDGDRLAPFRIAGRFDQLVTAVALSPRARARLDLTEIRRR